MSIIKKVSVGEKMCIEDEMFQTVGSRRVPNFVALGPIILALEGKVVFTFTCFLYPYMIDYRKTT